MAQQYPYPAEKYVLVGRVTRSHGLKGEIKVLPIQGSIVGLNNYSRVALVATDGRMTDLLDIVRWRPQGKQIILKLDTIDSKSEADLTVAMGVLCARQDNPEATEENHGGSLIGLEVVTVADLIVGIVDDIIQTGAHPLLIIKNEREEILVPLVDEMIVDRQESRIVINPPPGLLEINKRSPAGSG